MTSRLTIFTHISTITKVRNTESAPCCLKMHTRERMREAEGRVVLCKMGKDGSLGQNKWVMMMFVADFRKTT